MTHSGPATNPKVDAFLARAKRWQDEMQAMREIALACGLAEDFKWGNPCYTLDGANIVLIHAFKDYCAYLFFKGALMQDPRGILVQQTQNVQSARQVRITSVQQVAKLKTALRACVKEAVAVEKAGLKVDFKPTAAFEVPDEFASRLKQDRRLKAAFESLTPGRQRAYLLHFAGAKQATTRVARIDKCAPRILEGKGLND